MAIDQNKVFEKLLDESVKFHGHLCPGQVMTVRMSVLAEPCPMTSCLFSTVAKSIRNQVISRVACDSCGEWVQDRREVKVGDSIVCRSCHGQRYCRII